MRRLTARVLITVIAAVAMTACVPLPGPAFNGPSVPAPPAPTSTNGPETEPSGSDPAPGAVGSPEEPALMSSTDPSAAALEGDHLRKEIDEFAGMAEPDSPLFTGTFTVRMIIPGTCEDASPDGELVALHFDAEASAIAPEPFGITPEMFSGLSADGTLVPLGSATGCDDGAVGPFSPSSNGAGQVTLDVPAGITDVVLQHPWLEGNGGWIFSIESAF